MISHIDLRVVRNSDRLPDLYLDGMEVGIIEVIETLADSINEIAEELNGDNEG